MLLIDAIAEYLAAHGIGVIGNDMFIGYLPDTPATAVVLTAYGGPSADPKHPWGDEHRMQARVRGPAPASMTKAEQIIRQLHALAGIQLGDWHVVDCVALQASPIYIGRDGQGRDEYTVNFAITAAGPNPGHRRMT